MQANPAAVVLLALGLGGDESSPYAVDLIEGLPLDFLIVAIRGNETAGGDTSVKFFIKSDTSNVTTVFNIVSRLLPGRPVYGVGISMGGALLLQAQYKGEIALSSLVIISTSLWYSHALQTMHLTWKGIIAKRILVWWQFWCLFNNPNYLHGKTSWLDWLKLLCASSMLTQDVVLCKYYEMDYDEYMRGLDLRDMASLSIPLHYLVSRNDPMFSPSHVSLMEAALKRAPNAQYMITDFGSHGDFTVNRRNDYMVLFVRRALDVSENQEQQEQMTLF